MGQALIDVLEGNLTLRVNSEEKKFNIPQAMKFPLEEPSCKRVEVLIPFAENYFHELIHTAPLEKCLIGSLSEADLDREAPTCADGVIETIFALENKDEETVIGVEIKTSDGLVLKQLPKHLRYSFFG